MTLSMCHHMRHLMPLSLSPEHPKTSKAELVIISHPCVNGIGHGDHRRIYGIPRLTQAPTWQASSTRAHEYPSFRQFERLLGMADQGWLSRPETWSQHEMRAYHFQEAYMAACYFSKSALISKAAQTVTSISGPVPLSLWTPACCWW